MSKYDEWIAHYHKILGFTAGRCAEATQRMVEVFPELRRVFGHVECSWGMRAHWWCVDPAGEIVDPTANQYSSIFGYYPWKPGDEVAVGSCQCCGGDIMRPVYSLNEIPDCPLHCSEECAKEAERDLWRSKPLISTM